MSNLYTYIEFRYIKKVEKHCFKLMSMEEMYFLLVYRF